jgi:gp16 family phage-associated protein
MNTKRYIEHNEVCQESQQLNAIRTAEEVRSAFDFAGVSISAWAKEYGFRPSTVNAVLRGDRRARIGKSHQIAVALGIKNGSVVTDPRMV